MYHYEQNPMLQNEILVYFNDSIVASINKANFNTDEECVALALFMVNAMNEKLNK